MLAIIIIVAAGVITFYLEKKKKNSIFECFGGRSHCGSVEMNPTSILEDVSSIPGLEQWVKDPVLPQAVV